MPYLSALRGVITTRRYTNPHLPLPYQPTDDPRFFFTFHSSLSVCSRSNYGRILYRLSFITRLSHCLNFVAADIDRGSRVILAGSNANFTCTGNSSYSNMYTPPYWHYYSLTPGSQPCGFGSYSLYEGISYCSSMPRISVTYSPTQRHKAFLTISRAQLSDAGTYTCGGRNPYDRSETSSVILGVIGKYKFILWLSTSKPATVYQPLTACIVRFRTHFHISMFLLILKLPRKYNNNNNNFAMSVYLVLRVRF